MQTTSQMSIPAFVPSQGFENNEQGSLFTLLGDPWSFHSLLFFQHVYSGSDVTVENPKYVFWEAQDFDCEEKKRCFPVAPGPFWAESVWGDRQIFSWGEEAEAQRHPYALQLRRASLPGRHLALHTAPHEVWSRYGTEFTLHHFGTRVSPQAVSVSRKPSWPVSVLSISVG